MTTPRAIRHRHGMLAALGAALCFGMSPALAQLVGLQREPLLGTGLIYGGGGLGVALLWLLTTARVVLRRDPTGSASSAAAAGSARPTTPPYDVHVGAWTRVEKLQLIASVAFGGTGAPLLLLWGLGQLDASTTALLLNLEMPLTVLVAALLFRERLGPRVLPAIGFIGTGAVWLAFRSSPHTLSVGAIAVPTSSLWGGLAISGACLCWAFDTNLTQRLSGRDPRLLVILKGLGSVLVTLPLWAWHHDHVPPMGVALGGLAVGVVCYGASMLLFVVALRELGTSATATLFATAPFLGGIGALVLERRLPDWTLLGAGLLMAVGVRLLRPRARARAAGV